MMKLIHSIASFFPKVIFLLLLTAISSTGWTEEQAKPSELLPYEATYTASLSGIPVNGSAERTLKKNSDNSWSLTFKADMLLYSFTEESRFRFHNGQIEPESYNMQKGALGRKQSAEISFDWGSKTANSRENDERWKVPLQKADLDRISYQQQLQYDVSRGQKEFSYNIISEDERDTYTFQPDGEEILETPLGPLATVRLKMVRKNNKRQTWIWLAKDWNDLLVQLKQTEKGKDYVVSIRDATVDNKVVKGKRTTASM